MIRAIIVNFIAELGKRNAILAPLIRFMHSLALSLHLGQEMFEAFMLNLLLIFLHLQAIRAFLIWTMLALMLYFFQRLLRYSQTIYAFSLRPVVAMRLLNLQLTQWLRSFLGRTAVVLGGGIYHLVV